MTNIYGEWNRRDFEKDIKLARKILIEAKKRMGAREIHKIFLKTMKIPYPTLVLELNFPIAVTKYKIQNNYQFVGRGHKRYWCELDS